MKQVFSMTHSLFNGDTLQIVDKLIAEGIVVDAIITDPPYGTTACKWDSVIPLEGMWERLNKLIKPKGAIVLFGSEPFSSALRMSNIKNYKYDWTWVKTKPSNFLNAKKQPMRKYENISVFYKNQCTYNPQGLIVAKKQNKNYGSIKTYGKTDMNFVQDVTYTNYPNNLLEFPGIVGSACLHPTQKPVDLMEYLVKTYTNEDELVLDFTMGSGTAGVACSNTNRNFIGIELDKEYFEISESRIKEASKLLEKEDPCNP